MHYVAKFAATEAAQAQTSICSCVFYCSNIQVK